MATVDSDSQNSLESNTTQTKNTTIDTLTDTLHKTTLEEHTTSVNDTNGKAPETPSRKLHVYTRSQLLSLSKSPLVKTPNDLPSFKDWFGDWHEQQASNKKEADTGTTSNPRDRRFRRDPDDADAPQRPSFRSTLTQPSQMGNFRHQSIRTTERDRDRDGDRERDRDKEGQERLRNLSDKYDRDRLALAGSALRNKDRDAAPHLASTARLGTGQGAVAGRRAEGRDAPRRKLGETSDDWRRGDPVRTGRDDRAENGRRENRDRARSKSRPRRDPSATRRERDKDEKDRDRRDDRDDRRRGERDEYSRRDRDDHHRRDGDDHYTPDRDDFHRDGRDRREYDRDRELEDDPRRWRDDGKRDERIAARRDRERDRDRDRGWDRWEPSHDRPEDRDGRTRRNGGRERRAAGDDVKDREDRRDKEKEPAWMDDYVPTPGGGILGGQGMDGELDGIQAWKKGMKEKERKEKEAELGTTQQSDTKVPEPTDTSAASTDISSSAPLDEMFKLLIKKEAEKEGSRSGESSSIEPASQPFEDNYSGPRTATLANPQPGKLTPQASTDGHPSPLATSESARSLLSLISTDIDNTPQSVLPPTEKSDMPPPAMSRLFGHPQPITTQVAETQGSSANASPVFNPPAGSRLLAFGTRAAPPVVGNSNGPKNITALEAALHSGNPLAANPSLSNMQKLPGPSVQLANVGMLSNHDLAYNTMNDTHIVQNPRATPSDAGRSARSYSPFNQHQPGAQYTYEEIQELNALSRASEHLRRTSVASLERPYPMGSDGGSPYSEMNSPASGFPTNGPPYDLGGLAGASYATGKGSRFAKFFDGKTRDQPQGIPSARKGPAPGFGPSISPLPGQRQDPLMSNGLLANGVEGRTMEDIVAMLQNSAQGHRGSPQLVQHNRMPPGGAQFNQNAVDIHALHLQQLQQQHQQQQQYNQRLDSLYDSRLDDRNFVPDGMVPGLRPAPRPRSRGPSGALYNDPLEEQLHYNQQRIPQQHRNIDQMYASPGGSMYAIGRGAPPIQLQQQQFRGNPSPSQNAIPGSSQRLPPGLANLGGRPPHDPSQYINTPMGLPGGGIPGGIPSNAPAQNFNNFNGGGPGFGGNLPGRGPMAAPHHQNQIPLNQLAALNPGVDLRSVNQAQLLGMGGVGPGGNIRGGGFNPQHGPAAQLPPMGMRQPPQQQHAPPHMMQQMLPPHLQQQHGLGGGNSQGTQDLMALLMGGHRD
ncbi:hypothetical protein QCA50_001743 [Cerrena zonata]|uniref:Uncharacterized protein n=1 Tax=Cerrena zonata TaxID=2478898 RepID=A0AAW0GWI3_9APHY